MSLIKFRRRPWGNLISSDFFDGDDFFENRLFDTKLFNNRFWNGRLREPALNIIETDDNFEIELAAPGFSKKDFEVTIDNGCLNISAEKSVTKKEKWNLHKEYNEDGNLIKYDSVYSQSYSNVEGDSIRVNLDSIMDNFRRYFKDISPFVWDDYFSYFPKEDSLLKKDFFSGNYFFKN